MGRVKRWRGGEMFLRWSAAALIFGEEGFRKVRGYRHLTHLKTMLNNSGLDTHKQAA